MRRLDERGAAPLIGLVFAILVFGVTFAVLVQSSVQFESSGQVAEVAGQAATASVLARALLRESGEGWYTGPACVGSQIDLDLMDADDVTRAGLGEERCVIESTSAFHRLSHDKLENLIRANLSADETNDALDYDEARASLGLAATTTHFHLRSWPLVASLEHRLGAGVRDPYLRGLYIGNFQEDDHVWTPSASVSSEAAYMAALLAAFDATVPDVDYAGGDVPFGAEGDVLPDDNGFLSDHLERFLEDDAGQPALDEYNVLVVGSGVDHDALTAHDIKEPIAEWVEAGGSLVVLGSHQQAVQWLQPLFHTGLQTAGGGLGITDPDHPILMTPNELDVAAFDDHGRVWSFNNDDEAELFTNVVVRGAEPVLAISDPGTFGQGRVLLTSWQAFDAVIGVPADNCSPLTLTSECAGLQLLDNLINIGYRALYVDYGPPIPSGVSVASATDIGIVYAPGFAQSIEVHFVVYVF